MKPYPAPSPQGIPGATTLLSGLTLALYFRYDIILRDGLPDWRQPVFYYRRVRKMGFLEFLVFIFFIFTVGHFIIAWSIYLERKFELVSGLHCFTTQFIIIDYWVSYFFLLCSRLVEHRLKPVSYTSHCRRIYCTFP